MPASGPGGADLGLEPLTVIRRRWPYFLGAGLTLALVGALLIELFGSGLAGLRHTVPGHPGFYVAFALWYLAPPGFDYLIFRRLWRIPGAGFSALLRKRIANEVLLGYSGEAYFYAWARQRTRMVAAPFGAVKDVAILSAMAGNAWALTMVSVALVQTDGLLTPAQRTTLLGSAAVIVAMSLPFLIFSRRVFSLGIGTRWWIFAAHFLRLITCSVALALAWHFALPDVSLPMWLFLVAAHSVVSRLPLVANRDLLFASLALILIGQGEALSELMAFTAALALLVHAVLMGAFGLHALTRNRG